MVIVNFLLLGLIIIFPILLLIRLKRDRKKRIFFTYTLISLILLALLVFVFAWWAHKSDIILMSHYGYDFDAWNNMERFRNVSNENIEKVKTLETSIMGIGWTLKAMFAFVLFTPYILIVYLVSFILDKMKNKKKRGLTRHIKH